MPYPESPPSRDPRARSRRRRRPSPAIYRRRRLAVLLTTTVVGAGAAVALGGVPGGGGDEARTRAVADVRDAVPGSVAPSPDTRPTTQRPDSPTPRPSPAPARSRPSAAASPTPVVVPSAGSGRLPRVALELAPNVDEGRVVRYDIEVEQGLPFPPRDFARTVHRILGDAKGWQGELDVAFRLVDGGDTDLTVTLASPALTDELCAPLQTLGEVSCWNGERAVINAKRWGLGSDTYGDDLLNYRRYLIAHEVGHGLDRHHVDCPEPGAPAPIMVQQTKSLQGCRPNPYPAIG